MKTELNPSQQDYDEKFNELTSSPENTAFGDQAQQLAKKLQETGEESFYNSDPERTKLENSESMRQDNAAPPPEESGLYNPESAAPAGRMSRGLQGLRQSFSKSSTKKRALFALGGAGGLGIIVAAVLLIFMLISGFGIGQVAEIMRIGNYARLHLAHTRRTTQFIAEQSLNPNPGEYNIARQRRTLSQRLTRFDPNKVLANLRQEDLVKFVQKDGTKKRFGIIGRDVPIDELDYIEVGWGRGRVPTASRRWNPLQSYRQQKEFIRGIEEGIASSNAFAGTSRVHRTRVANAIFEASDIRLYRWLQRGRQIKTFKDSLLSVYDRLKGDSSKKSTLPEVREAAEKYEEELPNGPDNPKSGASMHDATVRKAVPRESALRNFARGAAVSSLTATLYCSGKDYIDATEENSKERVKQYKRAGLLTQHAYDQMKTGDTSAIAVMMEAKGWDGFSQSQRYQETVGNPEATSYPKDLDRSESPVKDESGALFEFYNGLVIAIESGAIGIAPDSLVDRICENLNSTAGQLTLVAGENLASAVASVFTGGGATAGQQAARIALQQGFRQAARTVVTREVRNEVLAQAGRGIARDAFTYLLVDLALKTVENHTGNSALDDPDKKYAKADLGNKLYTNEQFAAYGGRELTNPEVAELNKMVREQHYANLKDKPVLMRLANLGDPLSPASQAVASLPYSPGSLKTKSLTFAQKIFNPTQTVAKGTSRISHAAFGSDKVMAASATGDKATLEVPTIGWSKAELEKMLEPTYWPMENSVRVEEKLEQDPGAFDSIKECFAQMTDSAESNCSKEDLINDGSGLSADEKFRFRLYQMDGGNAGESDSATEDFNDGILGGLLDLQEVTNNTGSEGGTDVDESDQRASTDGIQCPSETQDLGTVTSRYTAGGTVPAPTLRLCQIPDIPGYGNDTSGTNVSGGAVVNSRVAPQWKALAKDAKAAGINLTASSSFRLADSCGGTGDGTACARPGTSMHQLGIAIDFQGMGRKIGNRTCEERAGIRPGGSMYNEWLWLFNNAENYGFRQYAYEPWHWDNAQLLGLTNRCDKTQPARVF